MSVQQQIAPVMARIESVAKMYSKMPPFKMFKEMSQSMERILPKGIGYDIIFRKDSVQHIFFEKSNPQNAIIL